MLLDLDKDRTAASCRRWRKRQTLPGCLRRMSCEQLEDRRLLAIDVQFDAASGSLTLSDVDHQNVIHLGIDDSGPQPVVLVNDWNSGIATYDVRRIHVFGGHGDDVIDLSVVDFFAFPNLENGNIFVYGGMGNDWITGSGLADAIYGGGGDDALHGGNGDDKLWGQSGIDVIQGQQGHDRLAAGKIGGRLHGSVGEPPIRPTLGRSSGPPAVPVELLSGGSGNDWFQIDSPDASSQIDLLDESGVDTLDFSSLRHGAGLAAFDLAATQYEIVASSNRSTTLNFLPAGMVENVVGTAYADVIRGNDAANRIEGGAGDDRLEGGDGLDVIVGDAGSDTLIGDAGNDMLDGGVGDDLYLFPSASPGFDTISDEDGAADRLDLSGLAGGVRVDLASASLVESLSDDSFRILLAAGQIEDVVGTDFDDILQGTDADNLLEGRAGNDLILAAGGNDIIFGGPGVDALDPGSGDDYVDPGADFDDPEVQDTPVQVVGDFSVVSHAEAFNDAMYVAVPASVFPANATDKVVWSFDGLSPGDYELFATWVPDPDAAATNAQFVVSGLLDRTVNQQLAPDGPHSLGTTWASLGQLDYDGSGPLAVELRAANGDGRIIADAVRLIRVGQLPQIGELPDLTIGEIAPLSVPVSVSYALGVLDHVELSLDENTPLGVVVSAPTVDAGQGTLHATIEWPASAARETGSFLISLTATDIAHPTRRDQQSFWVTIGEPNLAPQLLPLPARTVPHGAVVTTQFSASDPDGPDWELRYSLGSESPPGATIDPVSGWLTWDTSDAPLGTTIVSVIVTDDGNPSRTDQFNWMIDVLDAGVPATLVSPAAQTVSEDATLEFSAALGNGLAVTSLTDAELSLALAAAEGTLVLPPAAGITYELGESQPAPYVKLRGNAAALNQVLDGLTFTPTANFRGRAALRVELSDFGTTVRAPHLDLVEIPVTVTPEVDAPTVPPQVLYFRPNPTPGALDVVGTVRATDPDPDQWLSFRVVGGNGDYSIDSGTGRLIAANDDVLPIGETTIEVEAYYELSPAHVGQGTVTIHRIPDANNYPYANNDYYTLLEDQQSLGQLRAGRCPGRSGGRGRRPGRHFTRLRQ